ncbi:MAG TPA: hypothetical protein VJU86_07170 [Pyrinomonadaceae bacterium]|nr:hypothetical protein [Pyrinomonadaceae bacterium]
MRRLVGALAAAARRRSLTNSYQVAQKPRPVKAPTTGVPGAAAALGWRGGALQGEIFHE